MILYWLLPAAITLGIISSLEDIRFGKIRNKWIYFGLGYAVLVYHILFFFVDWYDLTIIHFYALALNGIIALAIGVLLWRLRLWTAGDAKLYLCFALLVPPMLILGKPSITSIDLLINTFIPIGLYLAFSALEKSSIEQKIAALKHTFEPRRFAPHALLLFFLIWPLKSLSSLIDMEGIVLIAVLAIMLFFNQFSKIHSNLGLLAIIALAASRLLFDSSVLSQQAWIEFGLLILLFVIIRFYLNGIAASAFTRKIDVHDLREGMMPAKVFVQSQKRWVLQDFPLHISSGQKYLYLPKPEGLTKSDISHIKAAKINAIPIQETLSFAPFLFIGILLQYLLADNVIAFVRTAILIWIGV